jgi:hypothetical protein
MIKLEVSNKVFYLLLSVLIIICIGLIVIAVAPDNGHDFDELDLGPITIDGTEVGIGTTNPFSRLQIGEGQIGAGTPATTIIADGVHDGGTALRVRGVSGAVAFAAHKSDDTEIFTITDAGNVGIGTPTPGTELEVAGTIKTDALTFAADQSTMSKAPRVIVTTDPHNGCPPARPANQDLFTQTFTLDRAATIFATGDIIRYAGGRHDILLLLDGIEIDRTLTYTSSVQWEDAHLVGTPTPVGVGTHTLSLRAPDADIWGCEGSWGAIKTIIFE